MKGFRKFLMQGNAIDLAVAVVIGLAFNAVVQAIVKDMITPLISAIVGSRVNFASLYFSVGGARFSYGAVINAIIAFLIIASVVYWLIVAPSARLTALATRNKAATDRQCPECVSTIPVAARRCMYCTAEVPPVPSAAGVPTPRRATRFPRGPDWRRRRAVTRQPSAAKAVRLPEHRPEMAGFHLATPAAWPWPELKISRSSRLAATGSQASASEHSALPGPARYDHRPSTSSTSA